MINVNWSKIKPFEKKNFAIAAISALGIIGIALLVLVLTVGGVLPLLKVCTSVILTIIVALLVHIESRMLQIYFIQAVCDVLLGVSIIHFNKATTTGFFVLSLLSLIGLVAFIIYNQKVITTDTIYTSPEPDRSNIYANKTVMMFAPHEDDEINIYGGIIEQYVKNGSDVKIVFYTNGDVYGLGKLRIKEALDVAKVYGIPKKNIIFMGYSDSIADGDMHIYNVPNKELSSVKGYTSAYGIDSHNSYSNKLFTRENIVDDFKDIITEFKPDVLYCCDFDSHADHRAIGLFFEEALGEILKNDSSYQPKVYKGFAYSLAWMGKLDYYSLNSKSTHQWIVDDYMVESNVYKWDDRLRLPVDTDSLSRIMQNSSSYIAMMKYSSQTATDHANGILNNDKVFWERRTDSVLYNADIKATSGDASHIAEFKLVDSTNIKDGNLLPSSNAWVADYSDANKIVMLKLDKSVNISEICIYESPILENHIIDAIVKIGSHQFKTGELHKGCNKFSFNSINADTIAIKVDQYIGDCSILKVEAFSTPTNDSLQLVKLVNENDDFCYDYIIDSCGTEKFSLYKYPASSKDTFDITVNGELEYRIEENNIIISCQQAGQGIVTIRSKENPDIYDEVKISNPPEIYRTDISKKQTMEQRLWSLPMQKDYYVGLVRRLGVYK